MKKNVIAKYREVKEGPYIFGWHVDDFDIELSGDTNIHEEIKKQLNSEQEWDVVLLYTKDGHNTGEYKKI